MATDIANAVILEKGYPNVTGRFCIYIFAAGLFLVNEAEGRGDLVGYKPDESRKNKNYNNQQRRAAGGLFH
ncbi:MAG: hypothetical protein ACC618_00355 [Patescibacteria group bacterium]